MGCILYDVYKETRKDGLEMKLYSYDGPVYSFQTMLTDRWHGETRAVSKQKAKSNLAYQYKKQSNLLASCDIRLPGIVKEVIE